MSSPKSITPAPAVNPFDTQFNRDLRAVEVVDTRNPGERPVAVFDTADGNAYGLAQARADELWRAELVARDAAQLAEPVVAVGPAPAEQPAPTFTAIPVADILDDLCAAVDYARGVAPVGSGWLAAIDRAWDYLLQADTLAYDAERHALRVESATRDGVTYTANGDCQCEAFTRGDGVCWHRAGARLVRRALERQQAARPAPRALWSWQGNAEGLRQYISAQRAA
jgi:hypothetical protein